MLAQPRPFNCRKGLPFLGMTLCAIFVISPAIVGCGGESTPVQLFEPKPQPYPEHPPVVDKPHPPNPETPENGDSRPQPPLDPVRPTPPSAPLRRTHYVCDGAASPFSLVHLHSAMNEASQSRRYSFFDSLTADRVLETRRPELLSVTSDRSKILFMSTQRGDQLGDFDSQLYLSEVDRTSMEAQARALIPLPPPLSGYGNNREQYPHYFSSLRNNRILAPSQSADKQYWFYSIYQLEPFSPLLHLSLDPMEWGNPVYIAAAQVVLFQRLRPQSANHQYSYLDLSVVMRRLSSLRRGEQLDDNLTELVHFPISPSQRPHKGSTPQLASSGDWFWLEQIEARGPVHLRRWSPRRSLDKLDSFRMLEHTHGDFLQIMGRGSQQQLLVARSHVDRDSNSRYFLREGGFDLFRWSPEQQSFSMVNSIPFPIQMASSVRRALSHRPAPELIFDLVEEGDGRHFVATLRTMVGSQLFRFDKFSRDSSALGQASCRHPSPLKERSP